MRTELRKIIFKMNSFTFKVGSLELLDSCETLWELFIENQVKNAGEMSIGVEEYLRSLKDNGLSQKAQEGKLHVQLVFVEQNWEAVGFCITSVTKKVGEVEAIFVIDSYRGNKLGGKLLQNALAWMDSQSTIEQKLVVAVGNEPVFNFYEQYGFFSAYTTLFRVYE